MIGIFQIDLLSLNGGLEPVEDATVTVRDEADGTLASIFQDIDGNDALSNPFTSDGTNLEFYASDEARYRIDIVKGAFERTLRHRSVNVRPQQEGAFLTAEDFASEAEAEAGTATDKLMTPQRTKQHVDAREGSEADHLNGEPGKIAMTEHLEAAVAAFETDPTWELIDSEEITSSVSEVDFTDLGEYRDIFVVLALVTSSSAGIRSLRVSKDNGSTFLSGDIYVHNAGSTTVLQVHSGTAGAAARGAIAQILNFNTTQAFKPVINNNDQGESGLNTYVGIEEPDPLNAISIFNSSGNLTGGTIYVFGRK